MGGCRWQGRGGGGTPCSQARTQLRRTRFLKHVAAAIAVASPCTACWLTMVSKCGPKVGTASKSRSAVVAALKTMRGGGKAACGG